MWHLASVAEFFSIFFICCADLTVFYFTFYYFRHLESDPSKYGVHTASFLFGETWESYLQRMKKSGEWGDHIILQALADVFLLNISVYNTVYTDIRRTDITGEQYPSMTKKFHIVLGHVGESHYFSLRPLQWRTELPYSKYIYYFRQVKANYAHYHTYY